MFWIFVGGCVSLVAVVSIVRVVVRASYRDPYCMSAAWWDAYKKAHGQAFEEMSWQVTYFPKDKQE